VPVVWRSDRAAPALAVAPGLREKASSTLLPVRDAELRLSTETSEGLAIVHVMGDFDLSNVQIFEDELEQSLSADLVVIELAGCTFLDSSALQTLVRAQRRIADTGGRLVLVAPSQPAKRVLDIATLDRFIPVAATLAAAVTSVA
jgi:anti-anti-sigma factor